MPAYTSHFRCVLTSNHFILCFGGLTDQMEVAQQLGSSVQQPPRLYSFDYLDGLWNRIDTAGLLQSMALFKFGMAFHREQLFLFGGQAYQEGQLVTQDRLYILNLNSMVWYETRTYGTPPSARHGFTLTRYGNELWLVGGCNL